MRSWCSFNSEIQGQRARRFGPLGEEEHRRAMFHILNMPRRFWTITEWMKAVSTSQGMMATFSIGSQLQ